jgi:transmembrane sensor
MVIGEDDRLRRDAAAWFARLQGPGGEGARAGFEAWCAQAPDHRPAYDRLVQRFEESAILGHSRLAGLRMRQTPGRRAAPPILWWGPLAAGLVAAAGLGVITWRGVAPWPAPGQQRYATAAGEIRTVTLANGVSVTLDTDSQITAKTRSGAPLLRLDRGRARIQTPGSLTAEAGETRIQAEQGMFDLRRLDQNAVDVAALSGRVAIQTRRADAAPIPVRDVRLTAGQQLRIQPGRAAALQAAPAMSRDWPSGLLTFEGAPLETVIAEANRYGANKIRLAEPALGQLRVTGGFRVTRPEALSRALAAAFGLQLTTAPGGDLILSRRAA